MAEVRRFNGKVINGRIKEQFEGVRLLTGGSSVGVTTVEFAASGLKLVSVYRGFSCVRLIEIREAAVAVARP